MIATSLIWMITFWRLHVKTFHAISFFVSSLAYMHFSLSIHNGWKLLLPSGPCSAFSRLVLVDRFFSNGWEGIGTWLAASIQRLAAPKLSSETSTSTLNRNIEIIVRKFLSDLVNVHMTILSINHLCNTHRIFWFGYLKREKKKIQWDNFFWLYQQT